MESKIVLSSSDINIEMTLYFCPDYNYWLFTFLDIDLTYVCESDDFEINKDSFEFLKGLADSRTLDFTLFESRFLLMRKNQESPYSVNISSLKIIPFELISLKMGDIGCEISITNKELIFNAYVHGQLKNSFDCEMGIPLDNKNIKDVLDFHFSTNTLDAVFQQTGTLLLTTKPPEQQVQIIQIFLENSAENESQQEEPEVVPEPKHNMLIPLTFEQQLAAIPSFFGNTEIFNQIISTSLNSISNNSGCTKIEITGTTIHRDANGLISKVEGEKIKAKHESLEVIQTKWANEEDKKRTEYSAIEQKEKAQLGNFCEIMKVENDSSVDKLSANSLTSINRIRKENEHERAMRKLERDKELNQMSVNINEMQQEMNEAVNRKEIENDLERQKLANFNLAKQNQMNSDLNLLKQGNELQKQKADLVTKKYLDDIEVSIAQNNNLVNLEIERLRKAAELREIERQNRARIANAPSGSSGSSGGCTLL